MINVLIVDDEPRARSELINLLEGAEDIAVQGECNNAVEAIGAINRLRPDLVFLDIQMPVISGIEMLAMLDPERMPRIVFLTAYDEYAVRAFEEHAFDYLLKPTDPARLQKTLERFRRDRSPQPVELLGSGERLRNVPCVGVNSVYLIKPEEIESVASRPAGVYVIDREGQERFTELTLRTLEEKTALLRCHRQFLVNPEQIKELRYIEHGLAEVRMASGRAVPVSRHFLGPLSEALGIA